MSWSDPRDRLDKMTPAQRGDALRRAVDNEAPDRIREILAFDPATAHAKDYYQCTALMYAVSRRRIECAKALIPFSDLQTPNFRGASALLCATDSGDAASVKLMLEAGSSPAERNARGQTALMCAARFEGNTEAGFAMAQPLLAAMDAETTLAQDHEGDTALTLAVRAGNKALVRALLDKCGAPIVNVKDSMGDSAMMRAVDSGASWAVAMFRPMADPDDRNRSGQTATQACIAQLEWDCLAELADWASREEIEAALEHRTLLAISSAHSVLRGALATREAAEIARALSAKEAAPENVGVGRHATSKNAARARRV
jgi:hypothetical protein